MSASYDCNCREFLDVMGMSWYECMYGVVVSKALDLSLELVSAKEKIAELEKHIDLLNKLEMIDE